MNTLYELKFDYVDLIPIIAAIVGMVIYFFRVLRRPNKTVAVRIISIVFALAVLGAGIYLSTYQLKEYRELKTAIENGYSQSVTGKVQNFQPLAEEDSEGVESFDIGEVHFEYSPDLISAGYNSPQYDGGVIKGDGQYLKVKYVTYQYDDEDLGEINVIVQIDEIS